MRVVRCCARQSLALLGLVLLSTAAFAAQPAKDRVVLQATLVATMRFGLEGSGEDPGNPARHNWQSHIDDTVAIRLRHTSEWQVTGGTGPTSDRFDLRRVKLTEDLQIGGGGSFMTNDRGFTSRNGKDIPTRTTRNSAWTWAPTQEARDDKDRLNPSITINPQDKRYELEPGDVLGGRLLEASGTNSMTVVGPDMPGTYTTQSPIGMSCFMFQPMLAMRMMSKTFHDRLRGPLTNFKGFSVGGDAVETVSLDDVRRLAGGNATPAKPDPHNRETQEGSARLEFHFTLSYNHEPSDLEAVIVPQDGYDQWLPVAGEDESHAGSKLSFRVVLRNRDKPKEPVKHTARFRYTLDDVSNKRGICGNRPKRDKAQTTPDLKITQESNGGLKEFGGDGAWAESKDGLTDSAVTVDCYDDGAYGKLTVLATTDDEQRIEAHLEAGRQQSLVTIPLDEDGNHVADAWEKQVGLTRALPADWDEDPQPKSDHPGDGLSLYREYRGLYVLQGGQPVYQRLSPLRKKLFVVDEGGSFDTAVWEQCSGITAYLVDQRVCGVDDTVSGSRIVDFNDGTPGAQNKYAVRLQTIRGKDPDPAPGIAKDEDTTAGYTYPVGPPRNVQQCKVFPDRIRAFVDGLETFFKRATTNPTENDQKLLKQLDLPPWLIQRALDQLDPAKRDKLVRQMVLLTAIHEMGHACSLPGHEVNGQESSEGAAGCPMRYETDLNSLQFGTLQVLFGADKTLPGQFGQFCHDGFNCAAKFNVKDE